MFTQRPKHETLTGLNDIACVCSSSAAVCEFMSLQIVLIEHFETYCNDVTLTTSQHVSYN